MLNASDYHLSFWGILIILSTLLAQSVVAAVSKAIQPGAIPGKINPNYGHDSFVFRSHRTIANSLENASIMLATAFLAILTGSNPLWTGIYVITFALARIAHMLLYYALTTNKNPSPRSFFYLLGLVANIALVALITTNLI